MRSGTRWSNLGSMCSTLGPSYLVRRSRGAEIVRASLRTSRCPSLLEALTGSCVRTGASHDCRGPGSRIGSETWRPSWRGWGAGDRSGSSVTSWWQTMSGAHMLLSLGLVLSQPPSKPGQAPCLSVPRYQQNAPEYERSEVPLRPGGVEPPFSQQRQQEILEETRPDVGRERERG